MLIEQDQEMYVLLLLEVEEEITIAAAFALSSERSLLENERDSMNTT